jgi:anti-sigma-K factor RskA
MSHETFDELAAVYAVDALDGEERRGFEEHLAAGCARCEATLRESREALARLALDAPAAVPPPEVKAALLRRAAIAGRGAVATARHERRRWLVMGAVAVLAGAFFTGMFVAGRYEARLGVLARDTAAVHERLRRDEAELSAQAARYQALADLLRDPATRVVALQGAGGVPGAAGRVVWNPARGGQLFVRGLPPAPEGKAYELWTIAKGTPRPAGVFQVGADGEALHPVPAAAAVDVFAVTVEPGGGVAAPTGPIVLVSAR